MVIEDLQCYFAFEYLDAFAAFVDSKDDKIWDIQCWKMATEAADNNLLIARNGRQRQEDRGTFDNRSNFEVLCGGCCL